MDRLRNRRGAIRAKSSRRILGTRPDSESRAPETNRRNAHRSGSGTHGVRSLPASGGEAFSKMGPYLPLRHLAHCRAFRRTPGTDHLHHEIADREGPEVFQPVTDFGPGVPLLQQTSSKLPDLLLRESPLLSRAQISDFKPADSSTHKAQSWMTHRRGHFPHLTVSPLPQCNLNPCDGYVFPIPDGGGPRGQNGLRAQYSHIRRKSLPPLEDHTIGQPGERLGRRRSFDLHKIRARMPEFRIQEQVFEPAVVCEQDEPLAIGIEPPRRVDVFVKRPVPCERLTVIIPASLAQSTVWIVEKDVMKLFQ